MFKFTTRGILAVFCTILYFGINVFPLKVSILRANLAISGQRLTDMESDKDRYHMKLLSAEARTDRGQHVSSQAHRMSTPPSERSEKKHVVKEEPKIEDSAIALTSLAVSEAVRTDSKN